MRTNLKNVRKMYEKCTKSIIFIETESYLLINIFICMVIDSLIYLIALTSSPIYLILVIYQFNFFYYQILIDNFFY